MNITQSEIDRINELHRGIRRASVKLLKDALEIGDFFLEAHEEKGVRRGGDQKKKSHEGTWPDWLEENFPDIGASTVYRYMRLADHRELLEAISTGRDWPGLKEAERLIRFHERASKKNAAPKALPPDTNPFELLEAKLSNYVIGLWQLRYLETEIFGMLQALELSSEQIQRALNHVCQQHLEVKDEVMKTFSPYPRLLKPAK